MVKGIFQYALNTGQKLEIIYISKLNQFSQRKIKVLSVGEDSISAFCYLRNNRRVFKLENILSVEICKKFDMGE
ncbi:hypothetical protein [Heyndrickxia vini]|uniref:WYL domain-containing protein n=1 Tax=Heyndrickxia vini TaxID=1476025 RepID=A0ABX7E0H4_9BACI|nr:hypothetical protein [Heyndrickxia vini]QQZ07852.1 hypothetical protein I5776_12200 [Heyndrickxia vini]